MPIRHGALPSRRSAAMFIRVKKIGQYEYLYLVENVREGVATFNG